MSQVIIIKTFIGQMTLADLALLFPLMKGIRSQQLTFADGSAFYRDVHGTLFCVDPPPVGTYVIIRDDNVLCSSKDQVSAERYISEMVYYMIGPGDDQFYIVNPQGDKVFSLCNTTHFCDRIHGPHLVSQSGEDEEEIDGDIYTD